MRAIVTGSLSYDYIMNFDGRFADRIMPDKIHAISLSLIVENLNKRFGGTAGNIAYSLKLLGVDPILASVAGNDFVEYGQFLRKHGIATTKVLVEKNLSTSSYFALADRDDNQIGSFYLGASKHAKKIHLDAFRKESIAVLAPTEPSAMMRYVADCQRAKIPYLFDPAFQVGVFTSEQLRRAIAKAHILIGNDYEIAVIEKNLDVSHDQLRNMVPVLITTLAGKGSVIESQGKRYVIRPAKAKRVLDPTGAGDAYRSGFVAGYLRGYDLLICGQMASVAAVYAVEQFGTVEHTYTQAQFKKRYKENYKTAISL